MAKFYIDLGRWIDYQGSAISNIVFSNCTNVSESVYQPFTQLTISNIDGFGRFTISVIEDGRTFTYDETNYDEFVQGDVLTFNANVSILYINKVLTMVNEQLIAVNQDGNTTLFVYTQNSENNDTNKSFTPVNIIDGKFNSAIGLRTINIDMVNYNRDFNYVYIPSFERYYYVDSVDIISKDITRLHLCEDVLMSWRSLIKMQTAFVDRCADSDYYDLDIEDSEIKTDYDKSIETTIVLSSSGTNVFSEDTTPYVLTVVRK